MFPQPTPHRLGLTLKHLATSPQILVSLGLIAWLSLSSWFGLILAFAVVSDLAYTYCTIDDPLPERSKVRIQ